MIIKLSPVRSDASMAIVKQGDTLVINGQALSFEQLPDGASLPATAMRCDWINHAVERIDGDLVVTVTIPHGADASEAARFPADIHNPVDGGVTLPIPPPLATPPVQGAVVIDWSQVVTQEMKAQEAARLHLSEVVAETTSRREAADAAIAPLQDAVDLEEATEAEAAELKAWKRYRVSLNRLPEQESYPNEIQWPTPPA